MKLHIGCGKRYFEGWTNLDINNPTADVQDDVRTLDKVKDGSCDIIYACHVLEHVGRKEYIEVLKVWKRKLAKGGILRIAVPDLQKVVEMYDGTNLQLFWGFLYGGQRDKYDYHTVGFDELTLSSTLKEIGFHDIRRWNWRDVDHGKYDDYSQSYLPHMDKENGTLMSLNIEAIK